MVGKASIASIAVLATGVAFLTLPLMPQNIFGLNLLAAPVEPLAGEDDEDRHDKFLNETDADNPDFIPIYSRLPSAPPTQVPSKVPSSNPSVEPTFVPTNLRSQSPSSSSPPSTQLPSTSVPSTRPSSDCTADENGSFGDTSTGNESLIKYNYELTTQTNDATLLNDKILPALEVAISNRLLTLIYSKNCAGRRRLELVGLSAIPSDVVYENVPCKAGATDNIFISSASCTVVQGQATLFTTGSNTSNEIERALLSIKEGMEEGALTGSHPDIVEVYYIEDFTSYVTRIVDPAENAGDNKQSWVRSNLVATIMIALASTLVLLVTIGLIVRRRVRRREESEEEDDNLGTSL